LNGRGRKREQRGTPRGPPTSRSKTPILTARNADLDSKNNNLDNKVLHLKLEVNQLGVIACAHSTNSIAKSWTT
jgi:hypothetical protein